MRLPRSLPRRRFLQLGAAIAVGAPGARAAAAQTYPARPVRILVGFAPGGPNDVLARLLGQILSTRLGQPFVVENRPGAGSNLATGAVAHAAADGYTLLLAGSPNAINATLYERLEFDFVRDIAPVAGIMRGPLVVVAHPSVPARTIPELVAHAKATPGTLSYGSGGVGGITHISGELFAMMAGVDIVHVPYRGVSPALTDLLSGEVQLLFANPSQTLQHVAGGRLRALGATTATRLAAFPDLPAVAESVPGYEASAFFGLAAPRDTPVPIVTRLNAAVNAGLADDAVRARLAELDGVLLGGPPAAFGRVIAEETDKWGQVIRAAHIRPD